MAMLHAMEPRETALLSDAVFLAAIYVDPRYHILLKCSQKTVAQTHAAALWRHLQMLQKSIGTTDVECLDSSLESENGSTPACWVDIIDEVLATLDTCNTSLSQSLRDKQKVTEMIKCSNNHACPTRNTNMFEWWDKQVKSDFKRAAFALLITRARFERAFSRLRYILNELRLGLKEDIFEAIMFQRCSI